MSQPAARVGDRVGAHGASGAPSAAIASALIAQSADAGAVGAQLVAAGSGCGAIVQGASTVIVEGEPAARLSDPVNHGRSTLREGTARVLIDGLPASRAGDGSTCGGRVVTHATRTFFGGDPTSAAAPPEMDRAAMIGAMLAGMQRARETRDPANETRVADAGCEAAGTTFDAAVDAQQAARADLERARIARDAARDEAYQAARARSMQTPEVQAAIARYHQAEADFAQAQARVGDAVIARVRAQDEDVARREREVYGPDGPTLQQRVVNGAEGLGAFVGSLLVNGVRSAGEQAWGVGRGIVGALSDPPGVARSIGRGIASFFAPRDPAEVARAADALDRAQARQEHDNAIRRVDHPAEVEWGEASTVAELVIGPMIFGEILGWGWRSARAFFARTREPAPPVPPPAVREDVCDTCAANAGGQGLRAPPRNVSPQDIYPEFESTTTPQGRAALWLQIVSFGRARARAEAFARARGWRPDQPLRVVRHAGETVGSDIPHSGAGAFSVGDGWTEVQVHGTPSGFYAEDRTTPLSVEDVARSIPEGGGPILLNSCEAGQCRTGAGVAQQLANRLGRPVVAPNMRVWPIRDWAPGQIPSEPPFPSPLPEPTGPALEPPMMLRSGEQEITFPGDAAPSDLVPRAGQWRVFLPEE